jgi:hypothetical protein
MASHHQLVTIRPRSLANVLADLREEFDARFVSVAGLTVEQVMKAREGALI